MPTSVSRVLLGGSRFSITRGLQNSFSNAAWIFPGCGVGATLVDSTFSAVLLNLLAMMIRGDKPLNLLLPSFARIRHPIVDDMSRT